MVDGILANVGIGMGVPNSFLISCNRCPCTDTHWNRTFSTWCRRVKNSLVRFLWWLEHWLWTAKEKSCDPDRFHLSSGKRLSQLSMERGLGMTAGWLGTWEKMSSVVWFYFLKFSGIVQAIRELSLCIVSWLSLKFWTENSSTRNSWAPFISPISCIFLIWVSRSAFSFITNSSCSRTCSLRDSTYPWWASCNSNRWAQVCRWSSFLQLLRDSTLCSCFKSSDLAWVSKWSLFPSRRDFAIFAGLENLKIGSLLPKTCWCFKENWSRKLCLDSTCSDLKKNTATSLYRQVSLFLRVLELETSSFLVQSDKLVILLHLLLAPVGTVVKPADHEVVRHRSPSPVVSRCLPPSHGLKVETTGCRTRNLHDPQTQWSYCFQ